MNIDPAIIIAIIAAGVSGLGLWQGRGKLSADTAETYMAIAKNAGSELVLERELRQALAERVDDLIVRIESLEAQLKAALVREELLKERVRYLEAEVKRLENENQALKKQVGTGPLGADTSVEKENGD